MSELTRILEQIQQGNQAASEALLPAVYDELRQLAARKMVNERPGHTLDATGLVHEAYLRLVIPSSKTSAENRPQWQGRAHFFSAAAEAMRRILIENARRKQRVKHGGELARIELRDPVAPQSDEKLLALDEALDALAEEDPIAARVVELRFFTGLGYQQIAETVGITVHSTRNKWAYARAWLSEAMKDQGSNSGQVIAGRYTLQEKIGEGGMGEVWVARQSEPVKRRVALKLVKTGMDSAAVLRRYEQERQALAMMDHPNIAQVFDGGLTPSGQPFFVMELVNGLSLTAFCDEAKLTPRERLNSSCRSVTPSSMLIKKASSTAI
jgi:RNA polymerase sigma factor (TIGR02999 family)